MGASLNVEIGGFVVKLVCPDSALERRIKSAFHCVPGIAAPATPGVPTILSSDLSGVARGAKPEGRRRKPILTLVVYICSRRTKADAPSASRRLPARASRLAATIKDIRLADPKSSSLAVLDGEGEYVATFDLAARRAVIRLTGSDATLALANFIRRIFARLVIDNNGAVFHSACVVRRGRAYIFFGKSGSGKSTVCQATLTCPRVALGRSRERFLRRQGYGGQVAQASELSRGATIACHALRVASDDLTLIRVMGGRLLAWGLPALRSPPYQLSRGVFPVRAAFTLVKDRRNFVKRLEATAAIAGMLAFSSDLSEPEQVGKTVDLLARLVHNVPCYELHFRKDRAFWNAIDAELNKKEIQPRMDTDAHG